MKQIFIVLLCVMCVSTYAQEWGAFSFSDLTLSERDKRYHLYAGVAIGSGASFVAWKYLKVPEGQSRELTSAFAGALVAWTAGSFKEMIWDYKLGMGTPEGEDAFWTYIGGIVGAIATPYLSKWLFTDTHKQKQLDHEYVQF